MRKTKFVNNEYYHIYNRGVDKRKIFLDGKDYWKFLKNIKEFNNTSYYEERAKVLEDKKELSSFLGELEKVVDIVAYSLLPNHYHFIIRQLTDNGIPHFMHKIGTSFTNYFNKKYNRFGSLFQGPYKSIHVEDNNYLLWLSSYVNGNSEIHKIKNAEFYQWSGFKNFLKREKNEISGDTSIIFSQFKTPQEYKIFTAQVIKESRIKKDMKKTLLLEEF